MNVVVVGGGYVGLVTAACLAEVGARAVCVDVDARKIDQLSRGEIPLYEPGLTELVARNVSRGRLAFSCDLEAHVPSAEVVFIAVGTPPRADGSADLRQVDAAAERVAACAPRDLVLVLKSTVPVGTNGRVRRLVEGAPHRIHVVSNPEFLKEGEAISDFMYPDRVVVGCEAADLHAREIMRRLYAPIARAEDRLLFMDPASAELTKYVANTMLAMRISFMNEVASLCEKVGADVNDVRAGVGSDSRIGARFLMPGPGYGGSCFPKDVKALVHTGREWGLELELAASTDRVNARQKGVLLRKLRARLGHDLRGRRVALWGLAFKPGTDDVRESSAISLAESLVGDGALVSAHDPEALETARALLGEDVDFADDPYAAALGADALVLVTDWAEYAEPDFARLRRIMRGRAIVDGRNLWSKLDASALGFDYDGVGAAPAAAIAPARDEPLARVSSPTAPIALSREG